jgi:hypothetical protein
MKMCLFFFSFLYTIQYLGLIQVNFYTYISTACYV